MYGTIFRMRVKSGREQSVVEVFEEWERERQPVAKGAVGGFLFRPDAKVGEFVGIAMFDDKESLLANAGDPAQDSWFRKFRELLKADPAWEDGEYVAGSVG